MFQPILPHSIVLFPIFVYYSPFSLSLSLWVVTYVFTSVGPGVCPISLFFIILPLTLILLPGFCFETSLAIYFPIFELPWKSGSLLEQYPSPMPPIVQKLSSIGWPIRVLYLSNPIGQIVLPLALISITWDICVPSMAICYTISKISLIIARICLVIPSFSFYSVVYKLTLEVLTVVKIEFAWTIGTTIEYLTIVLGI